MRPVSDQTHRTPKSFIKMPTRAAVKLVAVLAIVAFIPLALYVRVNSKNAAAAAKSAGAAAAKPLVALEPKRQVSVQAAGRGNPFLNLKDGRQMALAYRGDSASALQSGAASPRAGAVADLDGDAAPDLVVCYSAGGAGIVRCLRQKPRNQAPGPGGIGPVGG